MLDRKLKRPPTAGFRQIEIGKPVSLQTLMCHEIQHFFIGRFHMDLLLKRHRKQKMKEPISLAA